MSAVIEPLGVQTGVRNGEPDEAKAKTRVLLADDSEHLRSGLIRYLLRRGFEVEAVADGLAALELVNSGKFDLVVTDIQMPGRTGLELLADVRRVDEDMPVILITGQPGLESAVRAVESGAFHYFIKPFSLADFGRVLDKATQKSKLSQLRRRSHENQGIRQTAAARMETDLNEALGTLRMAYQPIVSVKSRSVFGYEALMRTETMYPDEVLSAAEKLGKLPALARAVRRRVVRTLASRAEEAGVVFLNLHPMDLLDDRLLGPESPLAPYAGRVVLEITERASLSGVGDLVPRVNRLRSYGYRIAIDDLGAGYASLNSFTSLSPDLVKLDMTLVRGVDDDPVKFRLVQGIIDLCHDMGIVVVGEGIETISERDALVSLGCDLLQGYLFGRPNKPFPKASW